MRPTVDGADADEPRTLLYNKLDASEVAYAGHFTACSCIESRRDEGSVREKFVSTGIPTSSNCVYRKIA